MNKAKNNGRKYTQHELVLKFDKIKNPLPGAEDSNMFSPITGA
jgi:hypothetical protein